MSDEQKQIVETLKRRRQDIEIMELLLKHNLTKKRAEHKLLIMYYKVCNLMTKAKLAMTGICEHTVKTPQTPQPEISNK